jgi:LuxR family transcriptional regulator, maltose regulon positive regulatory protein
MYRGEENPMAFPLLATKLNRPQLPDGLVPRGGLLSDSRWASLILVSAQAGSGKSTAVSAWLPKQGKAYCWYSLDDWDNDLMQFFTYLTEGIAAIDEPVSKALRQLLGACQQIGFEAFTRALISSLHTITSPFILVLDDYHVIRSEQVHLVLKTLLEHFPPLMQLVLITREDPPFPLARLRAARKLLEVRIHQLRFTEEETRAYFALRLRVPLEQAQLQDLARRTEGWAAGLAMTALSMQGLDDISGFIEAFAGSRYYMMDYLMEEVLERHPPEIKAFLLGTSILDSFSGSLCDAVLRLEPGTCGAIISRLIKTNSFIVSTDTARQWYRYHRLFRDLLLQRAEQQPADETAALHRRAGGWLKANGFMQEAIFHFLKAAAFEEAAALLECRWAEMDMQLQSASWLDMANRLPSGIIERSPVLAMGIGWALLDKGDMEAGRGWLEKAERLHALCRQGADTDVLIGDRLQFDMLPATVASAYGYIDSATGDIEGAFRHARYALANFPDGQSLKRGIAEMMLGFAHWESGDLRQAEAVISQSAANIKKAGNLLVEHSFFMVLGELYIHQGELGKAKARFEQTISRLLSEGVVPILLPGLYLGLAKIAFLQGDNGHASALLEESRAYGQKLALMDWEYKYYLLQARIYCAEGLYGPARECLRESRAHYYMNPIPENVTIADVEKLVEAAAERAAGKLLGTKDINDPAFRKEHVNQSLPEPLTVRELEVLSLIVSGSSNREICDTLFLALSTVKGYNQNIFGKLGVSRRAQAVSKAKEMGLA